MDISQWTLAQECAASSFLGVVSHLTFFIRGEHHLQAHTFLLLGSVAALLIYFGQTKYLGKDATDAAKQTAIVCSCYVVSTYTSIVMYRVFFHPLRKFPGPFMAKVSKIYHASLLNYDNFRLFDRWRGEYGDFVRTGPSELMITAPEAVMAIMGPGSKCIKAPWYDMGLPLVSMHTVRDRATHDKRRRIWDRGFNAKSLRNYEGRVTSYAQDLVRRISEFSGESLNVSLWFNFYSFDVMGDLAFGKSFNMLHSGEEHFALKLLHKGQRPLGILSPLPWLLFLLAKIPGAVKDYKIFIKWCEDRLIERKKMTVESPDIMSWLLDASKEAEDAWRDHQWLMGDSRLIIVAGSDTTAATLTHIFYFLAKYPTEVAKLRAELDPLVGLEDTFQEQNVRNADHLNGVINEALRLHPPVPSGVYRMTPPQGITIGGTYIPGNTTVIAPNYSVGRSDKCFERPNEFIPERWYSQLSLVKYKEAFAPFSLGPYGCIGKQLALMELRTVTALLVTKFDISFAPGEDGTSLLNDTEDIFTLILGDLKLKFEERKIT